MEPGDAWIRKPITEEQIAEAGPGGWACVFVYLGEGRMLVITEEGDLDVHEDATKFIFHELERLPK